MINKSSDVVYLFDFDGTLFGDNSWQTYYKSTKACFQKGPYMYPDNYDVRWHILTGRPRIDNWMIWFICNINGIHPRSINTYNKWFYPSTVTTEDIFDYKIKFIMDILKGDITIQEDKVNKLFYIDNDLHCLSYMNTRSPKSFPTYQALSVVDFQNENFSVFI